MFSVLSNNLFFRNKKDKILNDDRCAGFTFVELLIYIAIMGLIVFGFVGYILSISRAGNKAYVAQEVQANARTALDIVSQKIRMATGVNIDSSTFDSDPGVLSLSMADASKNPTIISLTANDGSLRIKEGTADYKNIISDKVKVTNFVFLNLTPLGERKNIGVQVTVGYNNTGGAVEYNYSQSLETAVSLRQ